jgi:hypothetical protein
MDSSIPDQFCLIYGSFAELFPNLKPGSDIDVKCLGVPRESVRELLEQKYPSVFKENPNIQIDLVKAKVDPTDHTVSIETSYWQPDAKVIPLLNASNLKIKQVKLFNLPNYLKDPNPNAINEYFSQEMITGIPTYPRALQRVFQKNHPEKDFYKTKLQSAIQKLDPQTKSVFEKLIEHSSNSHSLTMVSDLTNECGQFVNMDTKRKIIYSDKCNMTYDQFKNKCFGSDKFLP